MRLRLLLLLLLALVGVGLPVMPPASASPGDPVVTWPEATRIGGTNAPYVITVSDPGGTGTLWAVFQSVQQPIAHEGETTLTLSGASGVSTIYVLRCFGDGRSDCESTDVRSPEVEVRTPTWVYTSGDDDPIRPQAGGDPDARFLLYTNEPTGALIDWWVEGTEVGRSGIPLTRDSFGYTSLPLELTGLTTGTYRLRVRVTYDYPGFGPIVTGDSAADPVLLEIDTTGPGGRLQMSDPVLAPHPDNYRDRVFLDLFVPWGTSYRIEVRDPAGTVVHTLSGSHPEGGPAWDGRTTDGVARPGTYTVHASTFDWLGNVSVLEPGQVTVSSARAVQHTFRRTVTPAATVTDRSVGRCSRLRKPSTRGWRGSFGYATNTRCRGSVKDSVVATTHVLRVPAALRYGSLQVTAFGGASRRVPGSYLFLDQYSGTDQAWGSRDTRLSYALGAHSGPHRSGREYVLDDRRIVWAVYAGGGSSYDVKSFTITLEYDVLRPH